jgi:hypothetical protein
MEVQFSDFPVEQSLLRCESLVIDTLYTTKYFKNKIKGQYSNYSILSPGKLPKQRKVRLSFAEEAARQIRANSIAFNHEFDSLIPSKFFKNYSIDVSDDFLDKPLPHLSARQIQRITQRVADEHKRDVRQIIQQIIQQNEFNMIKILKQKQKQNILDEFPILSNFKHHR